MDRRNFSWLGIALLCAGCPEGEELPDAGARADAGSPADLGSAPDQACFASPRTHVELLNACTAAQAIDKTPVLPLLRPDGTLPPLP